MRSTTAFGSVGVWLMRLALAVAAGLAVGPGAAWAQDDPPGRVGRLADMRGQVWWFDVESGAWSEAERNRPLTGGDRISTAPDARAELRVGSTVLRLGGVTEVEVLRLDDEHMDFQLHTGSLALRVREREVAGEIRIVTAELPLRPLRSGHYRFDRVDDSSYAGTWRGSQRVDAPEGLVIDTGQRAEFWREGATRTLRHAWGPLPDDDFSQWVASEDLRDQRSAATRHVSPEMTGAEDLDRHGRWDTHPEYGAVWIPFEVRSGWAPYRYGRWVWVRPWGWTWVDEAPWGFAPFHYGRWVHWGGRWGWWPGAYVARPVFAPALVGWVGGSNWGVSVNIGAPAIGWVPLAPREVFVPWYRTTPRYLDRVNRHPPPPGHRPGPNVPHVPHVPTGPVMYGNQGVPGAVTVVPRDVLVQRQPVGRAVITPRGNGAPAQNLVRVEPPSAPGPRPRVDGLAPGQPPGPLPRREYRDGGRGDPRIETRERREPRQAGEVRAPNEVTTRPPASGRTPAPAAGSVTTRPPPRDHAEPGFERRRERPAPVTGPLAEPPPGPPRPAQPIRVAPRPAPPSAAPVAPTAPAAPPAAGLRPVAPTAQPAPAAAPTAQPVMPMPAVPLQQRPAPPVVAPRAEPVAPPAPEPAPVRGDERKRVPESRRHPQEQLR